MDSSPAIFGQWLRSGGINAEECFSYFPTFAGEGYAFSCSFSCAFVDEEVRDAWGYNAFAFAEVASADCSDGVRGCGEGCLDELSELLKAAGSVRSDCDEGSSDESSSDLTEVGEGLKGEISPALVFRGDDRP